MSDRQKTPLGADFMGRIGQTVILEMIKSWLIAPLVADTHGMMAHVHGLLIYWLS